MYNCILGIVSVISKINLFFLILQWYCEYKSKTKVTAKDVDVKNTIGMERKEWSMRLKQKKE